VADVIADWKKTPGAVGIRIMIRRTERAADDPGTDRILRAAVTTTFRSTCCTGQRNVGAALLDRHRARFVSTIWISSREAGLKGWN
jgi:hypothetical protein